MKKVMLILLFSTSAFAQNYNDRPLDFKYPNWLKQAETIAEIRRDDALTDLLNQQANAVRQGQVIQNYNSGLWMNPQLQGNMILDQAYGQAFRDAIHGNQQYKGW